MPKATVFVDTSAIFALVVARDPSHGAARAEMERLVAEDAYLVSSSYVAHEAIALLQSRHGLDAVRLFLREVEPALDLVWIDRSLHDMAMTAMLGADLRKVSFTDWSSFIVMNERGIERAFAFDPHFAARGFTLVPAPAG